LDPGTIDQNARGISAPQTLGLDAAFERWRDAFFAFGADDRCYDFHRIKCWLGSPLFALALAITGIVVYDATGVRRQAGFHAERINQIARELLKLKKLEENDASYLREIIGHTPGEAAAGVLFGALIALAVQWLMVWS